MIVEYAILAVTCVTAAVAIAVGVTIHFYNESRHR